MPLLKLYGVPTCCSQTRLLDLCGALKDQVADVEPLHLTRDGVGVVFQAGMLQESLGGEVVVEIGALNRLPDRTEAVLNDLARVVGERVKTFFPDSRVAVLVETRDPGAGYWSSES